MTKHPSLEHVFGMSSAEVSRKLSSLRYDDLARLFQCLSEDMSGDSDKDWRRGRKKLARHLRVSAHCLKKASVASAEAWKICAPHMKRKTS